MRWVVRFGYDGRSFAGWARQPGLRTVEGELLRALAHHQDTPHSRLASIAVASRTDRGVSARANAFVLTTDLPGRALLRSLNGASAEVMCTAAAPVGQEFQVRRAVRRVYRYFEPRGEHDPARWKRAAQLFSGSVDVRSFGRGLPSGVPIERGVESVTVSTIDGGLMVEVRASSFVWGMVRKMVSSLREYDAGRLPLSRLEAALRGRVRLTLPLAEPEGLVLWEVEFPFPWTVHWDGPNRHQLAKFRSLTDSLWVGGHLLEALTGP
ncbi:MAG: hypothetical protein ACLP8Y_05045 [Thermoplasmata archaeon]